MMTHAVTSRGACDHAAVMSEPARCDLTSCCQKRVAKPRPGGTVKTYKKPHDFANATHSQVEIIPLTDANSAVT